MQILIVDDEQNIRKTLAILLETEGHSVISVSNIHDAATEVAHTSFDLAFVDLRLGVDSGMDLIVKLHAAQPWLKIVIITAYASIDTAIEAMKRGATDYVPKPFTPTQIQLILQRVDELRKLEQKVDALQATLDQLHPEVELATTHAGMQQALNLAREAAASNVTVLLRGESGTGKSLIARMIGKWSDRAGKPFNTVSCPAIPPHLLESELFGHKRGSFTGAIKDSPGRVAVTEGGTLFMDEIGDLPLALQPKLLRFLQDHEYERIGETTTRKADVRVIAATSIDLQEAVREGTFRQELFYRMNVFEITLPPLRERRDDIPRMADHFLGFFAAQNHRKISRFADDVMAALTSHDWPGNVRELRNITKRAVILCHGTTILLEHLPDKLKDSKRGAEIGAMVPISTIEEAHIRSVLAKAKSLEDAARILGIDTATLWRRRKEYDI
ncbi:MAG: sigma-54-dependent Fis family transcriptional regulator [bacterium]|nr:sigma-54-dependent Fis family transcriptional regulator [bacterium]